MITLSRKQILSPAFQHSFRKLMEQPFGLEVSMSLAKAARIIEAEIESFTKTTRELLVRYNAQSVENGFQFHSLKEQNAFLSEQNAALEQMVEIAPLSKIRLPEDTPLTAADLAPVLELIDEPCPENTLRSEGTVAGNGRPFSL